MSSSRSLVSIVGAGPGDPDLITIRGQRALQQANVILYDALVDIRLLEHAPVDARRVYVGKRGGKRSYAQQDINRLLWRYARRFPRVVRLKGGDPFVFGRGHEELAYLRARNIEVEVIPGISSATAIPLLQHVPLTRRGQSRGFWVMTATTEADALYRDITLATMAEATVVILMGIRKAADISAVYVRQGRADLPVMIVQNGSLANEKVAIGRVDELPYLIGSHQIEPPGIIVIGSVIDLHPAVVQEKIQAIWSA